MRITNFGTTTMLLDDGVDQLLFDAHFTRPSPAQCLFRRVASDRPLIDDIFCRHGVDRLRALFISHSHYDHVLDAPYIATKTGALLYGSRSTVNVGRGGGVAEDRLRTFAAYETYEAGRFRVTVIPAVHSKPRVFVRDIGKEIKKPLPKRARIRRFREGGSFDFYVRHGEARILIHPSCNFIEDRLAAYPADLLFLSLAGITRMDPARAQRYFDETIRKTGAKLVIPMHWDNFFVSLEKPARSMPRIAEHTDRALFALVKYCEEQRVDTVVQLPHSSFTR